MKTRDVTSLDSNRLERTCCDMWITPIWPWKGARQILAVAVVAFNACLAQAHEFWIDPVAFHVSVETPVVADLRVGQLYNGSAQSYFPKNFRQFEIAQGDARVAVEGRLGDRPALSQAFEKEGLVVLLHVTTDFRLAYDDFGKFRSFVIHKDAEWVLETHETRGLPEKGFGEAYSRYAKSLVAIGDGAGHDRVFGLETELVAGANPYTEDLSGGMPVSLLYEGSPRANAQIEVFEKDAAGEVRIFTVKTDAEGRAVVPVSPGNRYMLDAVVLREPAPTIASELNAVWESLWANLTFEVPAR